MSRLRLVVTSVLVLLLLPSAVLSFQSDRDLSLSGNVYYGDTQKAAENITVELRDAAGNLLAPQTTSGSGGFEFRQLPRNLYVIAIRVSGYERVEETEDLSFTSVHGLTFYLKSDAVVPTASQPGNISAHELSMPQKARDLMISGKKKLYLEKNAQGGLEDFEAAIAVAPAFYEAYYQAGMARLTLGEQEDAEANFRKSIELSNDKYGEADVGLGTLMLDRKDFANGEKTVRRGIELNPDYWLGHYELGRALLIENNLSDALKSADQAKSLAPSTAMVYQLLSNIHLRQKDYPALLADIDAYLKLDPDSPAGIRAKQLRELVAQKVDSAKTTPAAAPKP
ncbi:MAG: tetratricopeptide repeat protein [Candidatus Acidiferrales bacterium]